MFSRSDDLSGGARWASPFERRCIIREYLGYYRRLVVGGIYQFGGSPELNSINTYAPALRKCLDKHPHLCLTVAKSDTETPYLTFRETVDLRQHVHFLPQPERLANGSDMDENVTIQQVLPNILNEEISPLSPAWQVVVQPLSQNRCFIAFAFSHSLLDGKSGVIFHQTFLSAMQEPRPSTPVDLTYTLTQGRTVPAAFDTPQNLPISWSFLLSPLLGVLLPRFLVHGLGIHATAVDPSTPTSWLGAPIFYDSTSHRVGVELVTLPATILRLVLTKCREHNAKLTGLLHQIMIAALDVSLNSFQPTLSGTSENGVQVKIDNFAVETPLDLRATANVPQDEMGLFASAVFEQLPRPAGQASGTNSQVASDPDAQRRRREERWKAAQASSVQIASKASTLQDQPIGLLRYVSRIRPWLESKVGKKRETSYEISNLLAFKPLSQPSASNSSPGLTSTTKPVPNGTQPGAATGSREKVEVESMIFSQPANFAGPPLVVNVISSVGGPLNIVLSWQIGALGATEAEEKRFVKQVGRCVIKEFNEMAEVTGQ